MKKLKKLTRKGLDELANEMTKVNKLQQLDYVGGTDYFDPYGNKLGSIGTLDNTIKTITVSDYEDVLESYNNSSNKSTFNSNLGTTISSDLPSYILENVFNSYAETYAPKAGGFRFYDDDTSATMMTAGYVSGLISINLGSMTSGFNMNAKTVISNLIHENAHLAEYEKYDAVTRADLAAKRLTFSENIISELELSAIDYQTSGEYRDEFLETSYTYRQSVARNYVKYNGTGTEAQICAKFNISSY